VSVSRGAAILAIIGLLVACAPEPTASELTAKGIANLKSAKTVQIDGTGSIALKAQNGLSFNVDFKLSGDAAVPNNARLNLQMALLGMSFNVDTITVDGKGYTKDPATGKWSQGAAGKPQLNGMMDPLGSIDSSLLRDVIEVDRPEVDGRKTRHLRYQADTAKMIEDMRKTAGTSTASVSNTQGTGELWIRIDDSQIVRQLVKVSVDVDALSGVDVPAAAANMGKASMEMSLDIHFSHHGEAFPQITAPPVGP
jgi:hypothetical protein